MLKFSAVEPVSHPLMIVLARRLCCALWIPAVLLCAGIVWGPYNVAAQGTGGKRPSPASQQPPPTVTPQSYPPEQVEAGRPLFSAHCGFCHGRDAAGGESGPDLLRSALVAEDVRGDRIGPVVRSGRVGKGMPAFNLPDRDVSAMIAFLHDEKTKAEMLQGNRRTVEVADLQTGNAEAGKQYFNGAGGCAKCHSPTGDLEGVATRRVGLVLLQRMLYPTPRSSGSGATEERMLAKVSVTPPDGQTITGKLAFRDEFTIALIDSDGWYRSWPARQVKFRLDNPLEAHIEQLGRYSDDDMHNVLAYLQTLR